MADPNDRFEETAAAGDVTEPERNSIMKVLQ
jgi:hypothetical protein